MPRALIMSSSSARSLAISGQPLNRLSDRRPTVRSGRSTRQLHPCGDSQQMVIQVDAEQSPVGATYPARARATHKSSSDQVLGQAPAIRALALPETYEVPVGVQRTCALQPSPDPHASPPAPSAPTAAYAAGRCRPVALPPPAVHEGALQSVARWPGARGLETPYAERLKWIDWPGKRRVDHHAVPCGEWFPCATPGCAPTPPGSTSTVPVRLSVPGPAGHPPFWWGSSSGCASKKCAARRKVSGSGVSNTAIV